MKKKWLFLAIVPFESPDIEVMTSGLIWILNFYTENSFNGIMSLIEYFYCRDLSAFA